MDKRKLTVLAVAALIAAGGKAVAEPIEEVPDFDVLDRDGDGFISEREAAPLECLRDKFSMLETENEQGLNRGEYERAVNRFCR